MARRGTRTVLTGWGRTAPSGADVVRPVGPDMVREVVTDAGPRGVLARGLGRAYGDAAQNAGGEVLDMTVLAGVHTFDAERGVIEVDGGLSMDALLRLVVPHGWFPWVTAGTRFITVGGAVAADVHGKNHHRDGSIAAGIESLTLVTPTGEHTLDHGSQEFWATVGGMGLTGTITRVRMRLHRIPSSRMLVDTERAADVDDLMARMEEGDHRYRYSVAWIDCLARGASLGRAVLTRGDHAPPDRLPVPQRVAPLAYDPTVRLAAPPVVPPGLLNPYTVAAFNELWFRKAPRHRTGEVQSVPAFFHPLDGVGGWNRVYGPRGFLQYQFVVPFGAEQVVRRILERLSQARVPTFLAVLKRFGDGNDAPLSFPRPGWTLALDVPAGVAGLGPLLNRFDEQVVAAGGRVYLAKDSRLRRDYVAAMYPRLDEWRAVRDRLDPGGVFTSDLDRRLDLTGRKEQGW